MGYRSEVHLAVYAPDKDDFVAAFTRWRLDNGVDFTEWDGWDSIEIQNNNDFFGFLYRNDSVKWYSGYSDVQEIEAAIEKLPDYGFCVEFIRVGEESGDVEHLDKPPEGGHSLYLFNAYTTVLRNTDSYGTTHHPGDTSWIASYVENQSPIGDQHSAIQPASTAESEKHAV